MGQNLFTIVFEEEDILESILEGTSCLFRRKLFLFYWIREPTERKKIKLTSSLYWVKVGPCPSECERKDLMHATGSIFNGLMRAEEKGDYCRIKVSLDV